MKMKIRGIAKNLNDYNFLYFSMNSITTITMRFHVLEFSSSTCRTLYYLSGC